MRHMQKSLSYFMLIVVIHDEFPTFTPPREQNWQKVNTSGVYPYYAGNFVYNDSSLTYILHPKEYTFPAETTSTS